MPDPIDDLSQRWQRNPDAFSTIALCEALRMAAPRPGLVQQVGEVAQLKHGNDAAVLVAVGRMYMESQRLSDAQTVLVAAGKIAPRDGSIYRWLGEVLLRRGDAERSEKVLERSLQLGSSDVETRLWLDRARVFKPMQTKAGTRAVAAEIVKAAVPSSRKPLVSMDDDTTTGVVVPRVAADDEAETRIRTAPPDVLAAIVDDDEPVTAEAAPPEETVKVEAPVPSRPRAAARNETPDPPTQQMKRPQVTPSPLPVAPYAPPNRPPPPAASPARSDGGVYRSPEDPGMPSSKDVLNALVSAGIFETAGDGSPFGAGAVQWDRPVKKERHRSSIALAVIMLLIAGGGFGAFRYVREQRMKEHYQAEAILQRVEDQLHASRAALIPEMEDSIGKAFELDSRSPRAALDWLRERATVGLLKGGADLAFEDSLSRAAEVGVREDQIAFARLASFLFQGDTAGAAALMPKWDTPAANDAWYQLLAGATLERAGDPRAGDRYAAAARLDPDLVVAQMAVVRQAAIDGDPQKAVDLAKTFRGKYPDRPEGAALASLAWGRDPGRGEQAPPDVAETLAHAGELPLSLKAVPPALTAILAVDKHAFADAKTSIVQGLALVDGPGVASWLGSIALETGDEALARKAALIAVSFSAVYPPARVLAARVALLGDRLDEALKATDELEASSPDVAVVRAAVAYERVDADGVERALVAVPAESRQLPFLSALTLSASVLAGHTLMSAAKIVELSGDEAPWSALVAMDLALDLGELDAADKIASSWKGSESDPLRALRLSRLSRYQNKLDAADALSKTALEAGTVTPRTLEERVFVLVAKNRQSEVTPLLAKFPVLQANAAWLGAYANATAGKIEEARGRTASLDPPPAMAPLPSKVVAAMALAAMKDKKRGVDYIKPLLASGIQDPDLVAGALALGFRKVERPARRASFAQ